MKTSRWKRFKWFFESWWYCAKYDNTRREKRTMRSRLYHLYWFPQWRFLRLLANAGFCTTPEGCYLRWRDCTIFFWRELIRRNAEMWKREVERREEMLSAEFRAGAEYGFQNAMNQIKEMIASK